MRPQGRDACEETWRAQLAQVLADYRAVTGETPPVWQRAAGAAAREASPWAAPGYAGGTALDQIVAELGPLPPAAAAALAIAAAAALEQLHAVGVVRGDLGPSAVLLDEQGLGLRPAEFVSAHHPRDGTLAESGAILDDPAYLAPEQVLGTAVGPATDVFALGGVLAFAAAGLPPFGGGDPNSVLLRVVHDEPVLEGVPAVLRGLVKACLNKDPAQRPALRTLIDRAIGVLADAEAAKALEAAPAAEPFPQELFPDFPEFAPAPARAQASGQTRTLGPSAADQNPTVILPAPPPAAPVAELFAAAFQSQPASLSEPAAPSEPPPALAGRRRGARSGPANAAVLGTVVAVGVAAAFLVRSIGHPNSPAAAHPSPSAAVRGAALPGTFVAGPGCAATPWTTVTQSVADNGGLEPGLGGGPGVCGGHAVAFIKSGTAAPGGSAFTWTFRLGEPARCDLSVFVADADPSSGIAKYQVYIPASATTAGAGADLRIDQGKAKGQWVAAPALAHLALPDGAVQLRLTDAGSFAGDHFHVTASAVQAVCSQVP
jgi:hypothetical protein